MIAAPNGSKLIFTVFLHRHSPRQFSKLREQRIERTYANPDLRERYRGEFDTSDPAVHRYNDIAGYGEVYWDGGTRILVEIFFRGDRRRKSGQAVAAGRRPQIVSASSFYPLYVQGVEAGVGIENPKFRSVGWAWRILQAEAGARKLR
jgi:hypothetical protein